MPREQLDFQVKQLSVDGQLVRIQIWSSLGKEKCNEIPLSIHRSANALVYVYDITNRQSFENLKKWQSITNAACHPNVPCLVLGNKCDLQKRKKVAFEEADAYAKTIGGVAAETTALNSSIVCRTLDNFFKNIVRDGIHPIGSQHIRLHVHREKSSNWPKGCSC